MIHFLFGGKSCGLFSGGETCYQFQGPGQRHPHWPEVGSHFDVVPADAEQWSKEKKKRQKSPDFQRGSFPEDVFFLMVVFGILGFRVSQKIQRTLLFRQVCLFSGMPGFFEVVLHPKTILKVLQLHPKPIKKMLISLDLHGKLMRSRQTLVLILFWRRGLKKFGKGVSVFLFFPQIHP